MRSAPGSIANPLFAIPPGAPNHQVEAEATFTDDVKVWTMHPHMHLRGKDMTYTAIYPDGRREIILRVPKYDFGWQTDYWLAEPLTLPKGSKIHVSRALRQLAGEPEQSGSDGDRALGRSDVGRDDDRILHLYGGRARHHDNSRKLIMLMNPRASFGALVMVGALGSLARLRPSTRRRPEPRGEIPTCREPGRAKPSSACRSSDQPRLALDKC